MTSFVSEAELTAPNTHLFLSPHYDDIALSCGGTAALVTEVGKDGVVALLFGDHPDPGQAMTPFAEQLHRDWGMRADEVIAGRRAEEAAASRILGLRDLFLPFKDAIYRGATYLNNDDLFGIPKESDSGLPERIVAALAADGFDGTSTRVYAPLASGFHVDPSTCISGCGVARSCRLGVSAFTRICPIPSWRGGWPIGSVGPGLPLQVTALVDVSPVWTKKIDAIMAYPSQLEVIFEQYVGAGSSREEIDAVMSAYSKEAGDGRNAERFWRIAG